MVSRVKSLLYLLVLTAKARRQVKAVKPKKMIRVEGKTIVSSACNCGTSALVSRDGEVFVFGKDAFHCDNTTGLFVHLRCVPKKGSHQTLSCNFVKS